MPLKESARPLRDPIRAIADRLEPSARAAFLNAVDALRGRIDLDALVEAVSLGDTEAIHSLINIHHFSTDLQAVASVANAGFAAAAESAATALGVDFSFTATNPQAIAWARRNAARLIAQVSEETREAIRIAISEAVAGRATAAQAARALVSEIGLTVRQAAAVARFRAALLEQGVGGDILSKRVDKYATALLRQRAQMIARTEIIRATSEGQQLLWEQAADKGLLNPQTAKRKWIVTDDDRLCTDICEPMDGQKVGLYEPFTAGDGTSVMTPPSHPQCLPGDALIASCGRVSAQTERRYDGDLLVIRTASGKQLTCTPNHPILTNAGWVAARDIYKVGHVIGSPFREWIPFRRHADDQDVPAPFHEIAETLRRLEQVATAPVPITAEDFHGDGRNADVAIVRTNRLLQNGSQTTTRQHRGEFALRRGHIILSSLIRQGDAGSMGDGLWPLRADVRLRDLFQTLRARHLRPLEQFGRLPATDGCPGFSQSKTDRMSRDAEGIGQFLFGLSGEVATSDFLRRYLAATSETDRRMSMLDWLAGSTQPGIDRSKADADLARDLHSGLAGPVIMDNVVDVHATAFVGHVFNVETESGAYWANGIMTHNCRCSFGLVFS